MSGIGIVIVTHNSGAHIGESLDAALPTCAAIGVVNYEVCQEVQQPAGAMLMVRRAVWSELGGFDEAFFPVWFEDVDFCRRAFDRGYRFYYVPEAVAKHTGAHSIRQLPVEKLRVYW